MQIDVPEAANRNGYQHLIRLNWGMREGPKTPALPGYGSWSGRSLSNPGSVAPQCILRVLIAPTLYAALSYKYRRNVAKTWSQLKHGFESRWGQSGAVSA